MEEELRTILLGTGALTAIVGSRVDWSTRPQGTALPAVTLHVVSGAEGYTLKSRDGLLKSRVQIDCWGVTYASAKTTSRAVITALSGARDGGFRGMFHESTRDDREGGTNEADRPFRVGLDFSVNWKG